MTDTLEHFGVKGMKWGVRKDKVVGTELGRDVTKADVKWKSKHSGMRTFIEVNNRMADGVNRDLETLNAKYKDKDLGYNSRTDTYDNATGKRYVKEYETMVNRHAVQAAKDVFGVSPSGNWTASATYSLDRGLQVEITPTKLDHSGIKETEDGLLVTFSVKLDDNGFFQPIPKEQIEHDAISSYFLEHYGVKGMKWGVRRDRSGRSGRSSSDDRKQHLTNKNKGVESLSDKELKALLNRINMERQFKQLNPTSVERGDKFIKTALGLGTTANAVLAFAKSPAGQAIGRNLARGAEKIAVAAVGTLYR